MSLVGRYVAVVGPADGARPTDLSHAEQVGRQLAATGAVMLTGGHHGVMEAAARGARAAGGVSILPSVKKRGAMGAHLDIPVHHIKAMLVRSHFDAMEICVPDAPATDEIVVAVAVTNGGRPHARVGGLRAEDAVGEDGLR